jgi:uncharacterized protein (TIGR01777 family)
MNTPKKIILAGGSGFLGTHLAKSLTDAGYEVVLLSRRFTSQAKTWRTAFWDGETLGPWCAELEGAQAVINLCGRSVDCRYNALNRRIILESRLKSTRILCIAIKQAEVPPKQIINAASATIYADTRGDSPANDESEGVIGEGFSVMVCREWEAEFNRWTFDTTKQICLRIAITLGKGGGVMVPLNRLARLGLGGRQGSGDQYVSWLHVDDFCGIVQNILNGNLTGSLYNCASPQPLRNREFMRCIRKAAGGLGRFIGIPTPAWLLKIGAALIKTETELILKSRKVAPKNLIHDGYEFRYADLNHALNSH